LRTTPVDFIVFSSSKIIVIAKVVFILQLALRYVKGIFAKKAG